MKRGFGETDIVFKLCDQVRETALELHRHLRHGHLEKVYENGLLSRLRKQGLAALPQYPLQVKDADGTALGDYFADILVEDALIIEIKAVKNLADEHVAQLLGYLRASGREHGLLINFGAPRLEIRKLILSREE
ncbi:MAG: GxxExxY protein [Verrucomicrobia bacterium]|nr:GxxExxY protein [Verrucomicrobiota bacterium]